MKENKTMVWNKVFKAQSYNQPTLKHESLPIFCTKEFDFYRCVEFKNDFYGKTASELFNGNLRECTGRYSALFPGQRLSYWADSPDTARAEIKKHGSGCDILTFWAYDDSSSFMPCMGNNEMLYIVDGRKCGIQKLIDKIDNNEELSLDERRMMDEILKEPIDCIVYDSHAKAGGENFIFLEKGFKKLALRELKLRFGRQNGGGHNVICCAVTGDYVPYLKGYGDYFVSKCKVEHNLDYIKTEEYITRKKNMDAKWEK